MVVCLCVCVCRVWDPRTDTRIAQQYDENTFVEGKAACKKALQVRMHTHTHMYTGMSMLWRVRVEWI